jgi:hypothetical protein
MRLILILKKQRNFVFFLTNILSLSNVCLLYWNFKNKKTKEKDEQKAKASQPSLPQPIGFGLALRTQKRQPKPI